MGFGAEAGFSNSEASATPRPVAIFSSTTAVGLASPRSTREIIERLTSLFAASVSRLMPRWARSARTRAAMRALISSTGVSNMMDIYSSMEDAVKLGRQDGLAVTIDEGEPSIRTGSQRRYREVDTILR